MNQEPYLNKDPRKIPIPVKEEKKPMFETDAEYEDLNVFVTCDIDELAVGSGFVCNNQLCIKIDGSHYARIDNLKSSVTIYALRQEGLATIYPVNVSYRYIAKREVLHSEPISEGEG